MLTELITTILFRGFPEGFIHMYAMYTLVNIKLDKKKYIFSATLLAFIMVLVSKLPISYGIHSMLIVMSMIILATVINGLNTAHCISIAIINMIIQFLAEGLNVLLIQNVLKMEMTEVMANPISKVVYGIPSLIIFWGIIFTLGKINSKRQNNKNV